MTCDVKAIARTIVTLDPCVIVVKGDGDAMARDLGPGEHPLDVLSTILAPSARAIAVVADGTAHRLDDHDNPTGETYRVHVAVVVDRDGDVGSYLLSVDDGIITEAPSDGRILSAMRAALMAGNN